MNESFRVGISFGLTSGIITTLGLMVGLEEGTHSRLAVISGILTIAVADAFSDALGIHISEESESRHTAKEIWQSTLFTFLSKLVVASSFLLPVFVFRLPVAVVAAVVWGFSLLAASSYLIARAEEAPPWSVITEHLVIAGAVIAATYGLGHLIQRIP
jgi:VIT1/CCC1 family predicted Fe2+/Mn2+ transporter